MKHEGRNEETVFDPKRMVYLTKREYEALEEESREPEWKEYHEELRNKHKI